MLKGKLQRRLIIGVAVLAVVSLAFLIILREDIFPMQPAPGQDEGITTVPATLAPTAVPSITPSPIPTPTATEPPPISYTIQSGDTLWGIAIHHSITVDAILQINPGIDPGGMISQGEVILIPVGTSPAPDVPTSEWAHTAQVSIEGGGLRLRRQPNLESEVIVTLAALTPLTVVGRTSDSAWMEVRTPFLEWGWVSAEWLELSINLADIPVIWTTEEADPGDDPPTAEGTTASPPDSYPHVSGVTDHLGEIYQLGQNLGNGANVFSKIGDSITVNAGFLNPFGTRQYGLHDYSYLEAVIAHYESGWARTHNPFANVSLAAEVGWSSLNILNPGLADPVYCRESETPLECEYRHVKPSVAVIMLGTNDVPGISTLAYEASMREIIEISLEKGVIPLISTIPPMHRAGMEARVSTFNGILSALALEYRIPLVDYWAALQGLPSQGIGSDGVHPTRAPGLDDGHLSTTNLRYGIPMRNLVTLQALDAIWRFVIE